MITVLSLRSETSLPVFVKRTVAVVQCVLAALVLVFMDIQLARAQSSDSIDLAQQMYVAYYGRAGDPGGVAYWARRFDESGDLATVLSAFGDSQEYIDNFAELSHEQLVAGLFQQMFNRGPDAGGLTFYTNRLAGGVATLASIAKQIADGAQNSDLATLANKIAVANALTARIESESLNYAAVDIDAVRSLLAEVGASDDSVNVGLAAVDGWSSAQLLPFTTDYQAIVDAAVARGVPGAVLLVQTETQQFLGAAGVSSLGNSTPMLATDRMPAGSAGKPLIGLLAAQLHNEGLLNLDDSIATWLPVSIIEQIPNGEQISLRQLLNHSSGIYNYTEDTEFFEAVLANPDAQWSNADVAPFGLNKPAYFTPGQGFEYSNTGYVLAGMIFDEVLQYHHAQALRDRFYTPLGMVDTFYKGQETAYGEFISGYMDINGDGILDDVKPYQLNVARASSPVASSVQDLALFLRSLIDDNNFVTGADREQMYGNGNLISVAGGYEYGLGIHRQRVGNQTLYFHAGLEPGYATQNIYMEESGTSITAFINCSELPLCETVLDELIEEVLISVL